VTASKHQPITTPITFDGIERGPQDVHSNGSSGHDSPVFNEFKQLVVWHSGLLLRNGFELFPELSDTHVLHMQHMELKPW
jgi:hypothetical protein